MGLKLLNEAFNNLLGTVVTIWAMVLISISGPDWVYVALVAAGLTAVTGKQVLSNIPAVGGGKDESPDETPKKRR
jgi:uncharacterized membrane protein YqgA involved in biofilm formation